MYPLFIHSAFVHFALFSVCGTDVSMEIAVLTQSLEKMLTLMTSISIDPLVTEVHFYIIQFRN